MPKKKIVWIEKEYLGGAVKTYVPAPIPASAQQVQKMIAKFRKVQQDLIELADPRLCHGYLWLVQSYLNALSGTVSKLQLEDMSAMLYIIRTLMKQSVAARAK